jgi:hypothetical protein
MTRSVHRRPELAASSSRLCRRKSLRRNAMSVMTDDRVVSFKPHKGGVAGAKRAAQKRKNGVFDRLRKVIGNFLRRRRQARIRKQLRVIHRWENARRA